MILCLKPSRDSFATVIICYDPTMTNTDDVKEAFYDDLKSLLLDIDRKDKQIILGDFNTCIVRDFTT